MTSRLPIIDVMHLIQGAGGIVYESGPAPLSFSAVVTKIREGQWSDVHRVIAVNLAMGTSSDVTEAVAYALYDDSDSHPLDYASEAYTLVEEELNHAMADDALSPEQRRQMREDDRADYEMDRRRDERLERQGGCR